MLTSVGVVHSHEVDSRDGEVGHSVYENTRSYIFQQIHARIPGSVENVVLIACFVGLEGRYVMFYICGSCFPSIINVCRRQPHVFQKGRKLEMGCLR